MNFHVRQRGFIGIFLIIIFLPMILQCISQGLSKKIDIEMNGYFDTYAKPDLLINSFVSGEYQNDFEIWLNNTIMPRNAYIKIYNQLQYSLFDLSNFIVGKNSDIFEYNYICSELCFNGCDYSLYVKDLEMEEYVSTLCEIEEKLKK